MRKKKKQVIPVAENSDADESDVEGGGAPSEESDEDSGKGLLAVKAPIIKNDSDGEENGKDGPRTSEMYHMQTT